MARALSLLPVVSFSQRSGGNAYIARDQTGDDHDKTDVADDAGGNAGV
jgi:hypothetical protein